jgi:putative glutamine amidotransferase
MKKPKIGVILDFNQGQEKYYSTRPHYAIRKNYLDMISRLEGLPILIPYDFQNIENYLEILDGLMVIGGFFDINPKRYGENEIHKTIILNEERENFEFEFVQKFMKSNKPILGICNGMQVINVLKGGSLIQDIQSENKNYKIHEQSKVKGREDSSKAYHEVLVEKNSLLHKIIGEEKIATNSSHHQAIRNVGNGLEISAKALDGIIEAIEDKNHKFCIGVQWHPEFSVSKADEAIFNAFVKACK